MKKILMGLTAVFALSVAVPAFAGEEAKKDDAAKPAEKKDDAKPAKKDKKKKAEETK